MSYVGNQPATNFTSLAKQDITGNGGTSYTLSHAVANVNDIAVYLNNVRQEPTEAYSVNGTALTMTGAIASSDNFYVLFLGKAIQTVVTPDGSVSTAKIADSAVNLTSKVTGVLPVANGGTGKSSDNKGLFYVYSGSDQNIGTNAYTQVALNTKVFDLDSYFNTSTYRYTPQVAGYYYIECQLSWRPKSADDNVNLASHLYKNGNNYHSTGSSPYLSANLSTKPMGHASMKVGAGKEVENQVTAMVYFNGSSDYVDLRGYIYNYSNSSATDNHMMGNSTLAVTYMLGYRIV